MRIREITGPSFCMWYQHYKLRTQQSSIFWDITPCVPLKVNLEDGMNMIKMKELIIISYAISSHIKYTCTRNQILVSGDLCVSLSHDIPFL
jgi:hypothetical protein